MNNEATANDAMENEAMENDAMENNAKGHEAMGHEAMANEARRWTPQQLAAICADNRTVLVSAGAGSGKTAVMIERILTHLRGGMRLDRMAVMTFTRASAAEMKARLNAGLQKELSEGAPPAWAAQALDDLENTRIGTIDSFCQRLVKEHFEFAGVDPMFRVLDSAEESLLREEKWKEAVNALLSEENADVRFLCDCWDRKELQSLSLSLYEELLKLPHPFERMRARISELAAQAPKDSAWYREIVGNAEQQTESLSEDLSAMNAFLARSGLWAYRGGTWQNDAADVQDLQAAARAGKDLAALLGSFKLKTLKADKKLPKDDAVLADADKAYRKMREDLKDRIDGTRRSLFLDEGVFAEDLPRALRAMRGLLCVTERMDALLGAEKREKGCLGFADMERIALSLMEDPVLQREISGDFDEVFVDECQDISEIQNAIIELLRGESARLFLVGDVKQSIYRFRSADPYRFLERMAACSPDEQAEERRIVLQMNFRSAGNVLDSVNRVFRSVLRGGPTDILYGADEELRCPEGRAPGAKTDVLLVTPEREGADRFRAQAQAAAREILRLVKEDGRDFRDIVILMPRASGRAAAVQEALEKNGIPVYCDTDEQTSGLPEIRIMLQFLRVTANPEQDVPLLSVLKSSPFLFTDGELADIRLSQRDREQPFFAAFRACAREDTPLGRKCAQAEKQLAEWRFLSEQMPLSDFLWRLLRETGIYAVSGALPRGKARMGNLALLCNAAKAFTQAGGTELCAFIDRMEAVQTGREALSAKVLGEHEDLVRIMTIHKSKGLEFPVTILLGLSDRIEGGSGRQPVFHPELGFALPAVDPEQRTKRRFPAETGIALRCRREQRAERARLLYVAMTRAKERMLLILEDTEQKRGANWRAPAGLGRVMTAESMADWVMQAVCGDLPQLPGPDAETVCADAPWRVRRVTCGEAPGTAGAAARQELWDWLSAAAKTDARALEEKWNELAAPRVSVPRKTSVTSLARRRRTHDPVPDGADTEETLDQKAEPLSEREEMKLMDIPRRPAFMETETHVLTGAERGTLWHRALELTDLDRLRNARDLRQCTADMLTELTVRGCFTPEEGLVLSARQIAAFYESGIGRRMLASPEIHREWSFNLAGPARTVLQGVIDCAFLEDGAWILVDYKTDRIRGERTFVDTYRTQLSLYAAALETITGRPVREMYLWSLREARAYSVEREAVDPGQIAAKW